MLNWFRTIKDQIRLLVFLKQLKELNAILQSYSAFNSSLPISTKKLLVAILPVLDYINPLVLKQTAEHLNMERLQEEDFRFLIDPKIKRLKE